MVFQQQLVHETRGRGTYDLTAKIDELVGKSAVDVGQCTVFVQHTSASLILCENADPSVRADLERYFADLVEDGDPHFTHRSEGPDDMAAHLRSILTTNSLTLPVADGRCALGTWQGIYLWEHRTQHHRRRMIVTVIGRGRSED
ncbi:MAG: YjbQ family protein [Deltaproteobacteria bacterium]|nr:YjbQ family protein [Deltaproteobacteria bacterium]